MPLRKVYGMSNSKPEESVHEENGATEKFSGKTNDEANKSTSFAASTDSSLNEAEKYAYSGSKRKMGKIWLFSLAIVLVVVFSAIFATLTTSNKPNKSNSVSEISNKTVSIGLKLAPTNLDIRNQSGSSLDRKSVV